MRLILLFFFMPLALLSSQAHAQLFKSTPESKPQIQLSFAPVVKQVSPAVVNVYSARKIQNPMAAYLDDPMLRQLLGERGLGGMRKERVQASLGSGAIISADGLVITNHHVIANADEVKVALTDKREFEADVILRDERTDLAVLRLKANGEKFPVIEFDDSDKVEIGDLVLAIGNPFGVGQTVTSGIVSALARTQVGVSDYQFFIQTDAAINPGNSGGPLIDMSGRLIGINTSIYSRTGSNIGIGYAIPANMVRVVAESARSGGSSVRRPWLGANLQPVTSDIAEGLSLPRPQGVLIATVMPGSPADKAGLKTSDVITAVDDQMVGDGDQLAFRIVTKPIGGEVILNVWRAGKDQKLSLKLEAAPENPPRSIYKVEAMSPVMGASFGNLSPALADELRLDFDASGVVVTEVQPNTPAARLGFKKGDILRKLNGEDVESTQALQTLLKRPARLWRTTIERDGRILTSVVSG